jgi:hypothetical protein
MDGSRRCIGVTRCCCEAPRDQDHPQYRLHQLGLILPRTCSGPTAWTARDGFGCGAGYDATRCSRSLPVHWLDGPACGIQLRDRLEQVLSVAEIEAGVKRRPGSSRSRSSNSRQLCALSRKPSSTASRSRSFRRRAPSGPIPVWICRSGACPMRTKRGRPCSSASSAWAPRNASTSASMVCCSIRRAPAGSTVGS